MSPLFSVKGSDTCLGSESAAESLVLLHGAAVLNVDMLSNTAFAHFVVEFAVKYVAADVFNTAAVILVFHIPCCLRLLFLPVYIR